MAIRITRHGPNLFQLTRLPVAFPMNCYVVPESDGLTLVEQHRKVYDVLAAPLADGTIHELRITTKGTK